MSILKLQSMIYAALSDTGNTPHYAYIAADKRSADRVYRQVKKYADGYIRRTNDRIRELTLTNNSIVRIYLLEEAEQLCGCSFKWVCVEEVLEG